MPIKFRIESFKPNELKKARLLLDDKYNKVFNQREKVNKQYKENVFKEKTFLEKIKGIFFN